VPLSRGRNVGVGFLTPAHQSVSVSTTDSSDLFTFCGLFRHSGYI
jgi:hypothetical protein